MFKLNFWSLFRS